MELRTALAAVLGIGLGVVLLAYPEAVLRVQTAGRLPQDRGGEYGRDAETSRRLRLFVRALGAGFVLFGLYLGVSGLT